MFQIEELIGNIFTTNTITFVDNVPRESVDLIICDGPYGVTNHSWDKIANIQEFNLLLLEKFSRILKPGGVLYLFGKHYALDFVDYRKFLVLQSRIIWYQPSRLAQGRKSYTNNYDVIFYFSKGKPKTFNLDDIRVPQLVELEHRKRVENVPSVKNGPYKKTAFNPNGKNPGDVWGDIKQLTYRSKELVSREYLNTIQKPEKLMERLVLASSNPGDVVFDPFVGTGTVPVVCKKHGRKFFGCEIDAKLANIAKQRLEHPYEHDNRYLATLSSPIQESLF